MFVTETMAELSARQGRTGDAIAIYRRLLQGAAPADERGARWTARLAALETGAASGSAADGERPSPGSVVPVRTNGGPAAGARTTTSSEDGSAADEPAAALALPTAPTLPELRLPLVVRETVRSGQIVYAQHTDLIALGPVNPGGQLLADGNIHVYGTLRGRAVAGVRGAAGAQVFCLRLEAELIGIDAAYLTSEDLPPGLRGRGVRVWLENGRCQVAALP